MYKLNYKQFLNSLLSINIQLVSLLILLTLSSSNVFAQNDIKDIMKQIIPSGELSNEELSKLRTELKINDLFIESVKEIQFQGGEIKNIENYTSSIHNNIIRAIDTRSTPLEETVKKEIREILRATMSPEVMKKELLKVLSFLKNSLKMKGKNLSVITRRFGIQVAAVYMSCFTLDLTLPFYLMDSGHRALGTALLFTPISGTITLTYASIKSSLKYVHLLRKLGLKKSKQLRDIYKAVQNFSNKSILEVRTLNYITINKQQIALTITEKNLMTRLLNNFGYNSQRLDYDSLKKYLLEKGRYRGAIRRLEQSQDSKLYKLLRLLRKIEHQEDLSFITDFKKRFGNNVNLINGLRPYNLETDWFIRVSNTTDFDQFLSAMRSMPEDIPPKAFDKIWRNIVLPELAKNINKYGSIKNYFAFRSLIKSYDKKIRADFIISSEYKLDHKLKRLFTNYIYESLSAVNSCSFVYKQKKDATNLAPFFL
jgi:hypothetical protein